MTVRILGLCSLLVLVSAIVRGQEMTNAELTKEVKSMKSELTTLSGNVTKALEGIKENDTKMSDLRTVLQDLTDKINEEMEKQQQILDAISSSDSSGLRIPRLSAIMEKSDEFRKDVQQAVHKSLEREGKFFITNKTSTYQDISVNRKQYRVMAGAILTLKVPVGTVTTQLPARDEWHCRLL